MTRSPSRSARSSQRALWIQTWSSACCSIGESSRIILASSAISKPPVSPSAMAQHTSCAAFATLPAALRLKILLSHPDDAFSYSRRSEERNNDALDQSDQTHGLCSADDAALAGAAAA